MYPSELRYTKEHTWLKLEDDKNGRVGITHYAQERLNEARFVDLPMVGDSVTHMEPFGTIESRKAASDLYSPVSGTVTETNHLLEDEPSLVNKEPYGKGWMILVKLSNPAEVDSLMSAKDYQAFIAK